MARHHVRRRARRLHHMLVTRNRNRLHGVRNRQQLDRKLAR